jgi:hypothetical protein
MTNWRDYLKVHPAGELFPPISDEGFITEALLEAALHAGLDRHGAQAAIRSGLQRQ